MQKKVEGIVINTVDYKESSKIINIFTKDSGIIGVIAKGSKSLKNHLRTTTTPLSYGIFYLNSHSNKMPSITEVDIIDYFKETRKDILKTNYSLFLLELSTQVYKQEQSKIIYQNLINSLKKINEGYDPSVITNILELKLLENLGIKPNLNHCVTCKNKNDIVTISSYKGGYICKNCVREEHIYNLKTLKLIKMFYYINIEKISKIDISEPIKKELNLFINDYYERYSGLYLKSKDFLNILTKI